MSGESWVMSMHTSFQVVQCQNPTLFAIGWAKSQCIMEITNCLAIMLHVNDHTLNRLITTKYTEPHLKITKISWCIIILYD